MTKSNNRKLLVSVFDPQEAREAVLGGGRIIDSEDPKTALGNISPLRIRKISDAVLDYKRDLEVQLSTNIGEDQLIFRRSSSGRAVQKSPQEMAGKAAQAALGVALSMGSRVHPCSIVKVGLDGMPSDQLLEVLSEVVCTLRRTPEVQQAPVMSVLFAQDLDEWDLRKGNREVRAELVGLREFSPSNDPSKPNRFPLSDFWDNLRTEEGLPLPAKADPATNLSVLKHLGILPDDAADDFVVLSELYAHDFEGVAPSRRTTQDVIAKMVDLTVKAGADAMMLDTSILSKVSNICLVDTSQHGMADLSPWLVKNGAPLKGILSLNDIRFFVEYCHFKGITPNVAGSVNSIQAQQLWALVPELDQISTRSAASAVVSDPRNSAAPIALDTRAQRTIRRELVAGLAPPEHGGQLNLPKSLAAESNAQPQIQKLLADLKSARAAQGLPPLRAFFFEKNGTLEAISDANGSLIQAPASIGPN